MGNNYGENGEITADGNYDIYFRPNADGGEDWFYGCIYVTAPETPTEEPTEEPTTAPQLGQFYVVGNFTDWAVDEAYKMTLNQAAETEEYMFNMDLTTESQFKVVYVDPETSEQTWIPDGMGNNYGENGEITADGTYTVFFDPTVSGNDEWFYGCIYIDMPDPATMFLLGDANGDGEVDVIDATLIQRVATRVSVPYPEETLMQGDIDDDGELTVIDATFIQRYATRVSTPYRIGEMVSR